MINPRTKYPLPAIVVIILAIVFIAIGLSASACHPKLSQWKPDPFDRRSRLAVYDSKTTIFQVNLRPDGRFYYTIAHRPETDTIWAPGQRRQPWTFYHGNYYLAGDTLYPDYANDKFPAEVLPFLVSAGSYYSQYLADRQHRVFMEIAWPHNPAMMR